MKPRALALFVLAAAALAPSAAGQHIGAKLGASFGRDSVSVSSLPVLSGPSDETTCMGGVAVDAVISDDFLLQMEVLYVRRSTTITFADPSGLPPIEAEYELDYFVVPVLARYNLAPGPFIPYAVAGMQLGFRFRAESENTSAGVTEEFDAGDQFKRVDIGLVIGGGVAYRLSGAISLTGDLRYVHGLTNIAERGADSWKTRSIQLMAGVAFRL